MSGNEFKGRADYTVIVFYENKQKPPFKMEFVNGLFTLSQWLDKSSLHRDWAYFNAYSRRSGRYLKRYYKGNFIENKPRF